MCSIFYFVFGVFCCLLSVLLPVCFLPLSFVSPVSCLSVYLNPTSGPWSPGLKDFFINWFVFFWPCILPVTFLLSVKKFFFSSFFANVTSVIDYRTCSLNLLLLVALESCQWAFIHDLPSVNPCFFSFLLFVFLFCSLLDSNLVFSTAWKPLLCCYDIWFPHLLPVMFHCHEVYLIKKVNVFFIP